MDHTPESAQFYLTAPTPCPYLENRQERKLFTHLSGRRAGALHGLLSDHGFRRSQNLIYRPACVDCDACQSVRVVTDQFVPAKRHRRNLRQNSDIASQSCTPIVTAEQYELFQRYLAARHDGGGMSQMSYLDYEFMVEDTPVDSILVEYRFSSGEDSGRLVAVALTDVMGDGLSMVYSFFDPSMPARGLGTMMILDHIERARAMPGRRLYLGYWVESSRKMAYKASFQPLEVQRGAQGWRRLSVDRQGNDS
ncbi:arginyltransferase [Pelagibacterium montanilacus]|uniref:arginyltransferase n=1 Tax=Pelagibacterium montanilacus TaxID=2185280 RepID=UPI000F8C8E40|nr:arginyltransferase [Pelagibacterium montanilacus]